MAACTAQNHELQRKVIHLEKQNTWVAILLNVFYFSLWYISIDGFINKCIDDCVPTKAIRAYPNLKLCMTRGIHWSFHYSTLVDLVMRLCHIIETTFLSALMSHTELNNNFTCKQGITKASQLKIDEKLKTILGGLTKSLKLLVIASSESTMAASPTICFRLFPALCF